MPVNLGWESLNMWERAKAVSEATKLGIPQNKVDAFINFKASGGELQQSNSPATVQQPEDPTVEVSTKDMNASGTRRGIQYIPEKYYGTPEEFKDIYGYDLDAISSITPEQALAQSGLAGKYTLSSGFRPNAKTKQGKNSFHSMRHYLGGSAAFDIVPKGISWEEFKNIVYQDPFLAAYSAATGYGFLDETEDSTMSKTGATGRHFHFGPDSWAREQYTKRFKGNIPTWEEIQARRQQSNQPITQAVSDEGENMPLVEIIQPTRTENAPLLPDYKEEENGVTVIPPSRTYRPSSYIIDKVKERQFVSTQQEQAKKEIEDRRAERLAALNEAYEYFKNYRESKNEYNIFEEGGLTTNEWNRLSNIVRNSYNNNSDFVRRLRTPFRQTIQDWENNKAIATHKLSYVTEGNNAVVYPNVQNVNGNLVDYTNPKYNTRWQDAYRRAVNNGDTLHVPIQDAELFTTNYKSFYPNFDHY